MEKSEKKTKTMEVLIESNTLQSPLHIHQLNASSKEP